jgi:anti-sigma regulatory factor (Ser/Thr protein kinase)
MTTVDGVDDAITEDRKLLDARPADAAEAREAVASFLRRRERPVAAGVLDDVLLVVSELVTNALRHAGGVIGLRVAHRARGIEVTVRDRGAERPVEKKHGDAWLPGGYGWPLVSRLAEVVVVPLGGDGKLVRATVPVLNRN